jgi:Cu-processing system ATP-binding protein
MIEFRGVTKRFGATEVLRGVNLTVERGRVLGLIGPNGAGKTTLIKTLLGLVHPTSGDIFVGGQSILGDDSYRTQIGYVPQIARFPENLTAAELFTMIRSLRPGDAGAASNEGLATRLGLDAHLDKPLRVLSGGTRQKVNAALALSFRPAILVLDEPTAGLDPLSSATLKDEITALNMSGSTVLVSSHIMSELEDLCDDVAFLLDGVVRFVGPVTQLKMATKQPNLERAIAALMIREVA